MQRNFGLKKRIELPVAVELAIGVSIDELPDGMVIYGRSELTGTECQSHGDHRIAMSCAVAGMAASGETVVHDTECIRTSYPGFEATLASFA